MVRARRNPSSGYWRGAWAIIARVSFSGGFVRLDCLLSAIDAADAGLGRRFRVDVPASNSAAVNLYQSFGFKIAGRSFIPETEIEYLVMTKPIQQ